MDTSYLSSSAAVSAPRTPAAAVEALYAMGHSLHAQERWAEAAAVFRILLRVAPSDERGWLALGECHERAGHVEVALELYGAGTVAACDAKRCGLARFRLLHDLSRTADADEAFDSVKELAEARDDEDFLALLEAERRARP